MDNPQVRNGTRRRGRAPAFLLRVIGDLQPQVFSLAGCRRMELDGVSYLLVPEDADQPMSAPSAPAPKLAKPPRETWEETRQKIIVFLNGHGPATFAVLKAHFPTHELKRIVQSMVDKDMLIHGGFPESSFQLPQQQPTFQGTLNPDDL